MCVCPQLVFCERFAGESAVAAFRQIRDEMATTFCSMAGVDLDMLDSRSARKEQLFLKLRDGGFNLRDPAWLAPAAYCAAFAAFAKSPKVPTSYPSLKPVLDSIRAGRLSRPLLKRPPGSAQAAGHKCAPSVAAI